MVLIRDRLIMVYHNPYMGGVSKNRNFLPKWMVKIMEHPIKMDDLGEKLLYFRKHPYNCMGTTYFIIYIIP